ncbi:hypothetical protein BV898_07408 [Hypsibius exemplaris]|uniref:Uncharacterized protein n=1 Tax=Hypsibius exemplaris TaxID=2072580 RepID=A0A1W0WTQ8_HYPEX|nr:hypothetical protein BV898_07408 [Hypsibius exemplaris]
MDAGESSTLANELILIAGASVNESVMPKVSSYFPSGRSQQQSDVFSEDTDRGTWNEWHRNAPPSSRAKASGKTNKHRTATLELERDFFWKTSATLFADRFQPRVETLPPLPRSVNFLWNSIAGFESWMRQIGLSGFFHCSLAHRPETDRSLHYVLEMIGTFETVLITVRGCLNGGRYVANFGASTWRMLMRIPVVRMAFNIFRWFWRYLKFVGRTGTLVGLFALLCIYVGRAAMPLIRSAIEELGPPNSAPGPKKTVKRTYFAEDSDEVIIATGNEVITGEKLITSSRDSALTEEPSKQRTVVPGKKDLQNWTHFKR